MLSITSLIRYPVKSVGGEPLSEAWVGAHGIAGDRQWGIRDLATGNVLTGRRTPALLMATARIEGASATTAFDSAQAQVVITMPDGTETNDDAVLSSWLETDVALLPASDDESGTYENPLSVGGVTDGAADDADWISWTGPSGSMHDSGRTMLSLASAETLGQWDPRRFRKNVLTDGSGEDDLVGKHLRMGGAGVEVTKRVSRCVMVTRPLPGAPRDLEPLKTINRERDECLGIGMVVTQESTVAVGDTVEPVETGIHPEHQPE